MDSAYLLECIFAFQQMGGDPDHVPQPKTKDYSHACVQKKEQEYISNSSWQKLLYLYFF